MTEGQAFNLIRKVRAGEGGKIRKISEVSDDICDLLRRYVFADVEEE